MPFKTIDVPGFYSRDDQWIVLVADSDGTHFMSTHDTKIEAVEACQQYVRDNTDKVDACWVAKTPHVVMAE